MSRFVKHWVPVAIAFLTGLVVLLGYLFPTNALLVHGRDTLVDWAVIVVAFAFVLGLFNILRVHGGRVLGKEKGGGYSLVLLIAALVTWVPPLFYGPSSTPNQRLLDYVIGPLGAALAALMAFTLALAAFRLLRVRRSLGGVVFMLAACVALLGSVPLAGLGWLTGVREWVIHVPALAGMRGLLLGVALGTTITALRVLLASDRPHSEY